MSCSAPRWLRLYVASIALAVQAAAGSVIGFGIILCLIWIFAVGIGLLRLRAFPTEEVGVDREHPVAA